MASEIGPKSWNNEMYEKHSTPYDGIAGYIQKQRLKKISEALKKFSAVRGKKLIEIGCEEGNLLRHLNDIMDGYEILGLDISTKALEQARKTLPAEIQLDQWDITDGPYELDAPPAYIICSETLEHIPDAEAAVKGISETSGDDTIVIITVPIERYKNLIKKWLTRLGIFDLLFSGIEKSLSEWHVQDFSKEDITGLLGQYYDVLHYDTIWLMHQLIVVKKKG